MDNKDKKQRPDTRSRQDVAFEQILLLAAWNEANVSVDIQGVRDNIDSMIKLLIYLEEPEQNCPGL